LPRKEQRQLKAPAFEYHRPTSISEALALLASLDDARLLAGGQSLMPMLNFRMLAPAHLIDLNRVPELSGIQAAAEHVTIGAMTRQREVEFSPVIADRLPLLAEAVREIGHRQTRNRGTIGGSLCHLDPSAELPVIAMALDAELRVCRPGGERVLPMHAFCTGYMSSVLDADEMLREIRFPTWPTGHGWAFLEFTRRKGDYAIVSAAVLVALDAGGTVTRVSITVGGIAAAPVRVAAAEDALRGRLPERALIEAVAGRCGELEAGSDPAVPAWYRQRLARVLVERALEQAVARAAAHGSAGAGTPHEARR
jgi:aerobic carbon-monoxide dehydrogenase medium subunit